MIGIEHYVPFPAISVSTLVAFSRCPRKFFYSFGVSLSREEHIALKFGEAIHAGIPDAFFGRLDAAVAAFQRVWQDLPGDEKRNSLNGKEILADYMLSHAQKRSIYIIQPPPAERLNVSDHISDYEVPFALDIGLPIPLVGRIDALSRHRDDDSWWVNEFKTSNEMSTRFFDGFQFNPQVVCYTLAARSMGIPARGAIVEGLKVSSAKTDRHGTLSTPVFVQDHHVEDFLTWAKYTTALMLQCQETKNFPKDLSACTPYSQFGSPGYQCEFLPLCLTSDWTTMKDMYARREYPTFKFLQGKDATPASAPTTEVTINGQAPSRPADAAQPAKDPRRFIRVGSDSGSPGTLSTPGSSNPDIH